MARTPKAPPPPAPVRRGRKPKAEPGELALAVENGASDAEPAEAEALPDETPARGKPGRKPKAEPGELALTVGNAAGDAEPIEAEAPPDEAPTRSKPGRKPKVRPEAALPTMAGDEPPAMVVDQLDAMAEPAPAGDDAMIAEMAGPVSAGEGSAPGPASADADGMSPASGPVGSEPLPPAAWWDRASDRVRFDWPAIERTASQEGPHQAMAKLLVAARAEGAHSRWPL